MGVLNDNILIGASAAGDYEIEQSLRFNDDDTAYLSATLSGTGGRDKFTYSGWVKLGNIGVQMDLLSAPYSTSQNGSHLIINTDGKFYNQIRNYSTGSQGGFDGDATSDMIFRDPSAWYHIVFAYDSTDGTAADRQKLYVNGVRQTWSAQDTVTENNVQYLGSQYTGRIGVQYGTTGNLDGYLAEINFIDGQALSADSFGETGDYGEWKPIAYAGGYGTNGFYLPFKQDYAVEGFSTVVYEGNQNSSIYIGGTGFKPDLVWGKNRSSASNHWLFDSVRGTTKMLQSDQTNAEETQTGVTAFSSDGFTLGTWIGSTKTGDDYVAWNWDMGGTTASNTNGSITSSVRANTTYGQSIVSYTGNATAGATVGHGLSSAPTMIIIKSRAAVRNWTVGHSGVGWTKFLQINSNNAAETATNRWNDTAPSSTVFTLGSTGNSNSAEAVIAYCFHDVTGYSKFGSYSGTGSSNAITTGFAPAFLMVKRTNSTGNWVMWDNTRVPSGVIVGDYLQANLSDPENDPTGSNAVTFTTTGFTLTGNGIYSNSSSDTFIYMCFADTREYAYWLDQSGNNNDWTSNNLTESDVMVDSPTNNFCTLNPLDEGGTNTVAEGNLQYTKSGSNFGPMRGTLGVTTGKWYFEAMRSSNSNICQVGVSNNYDISQNGGDNTMGNAGGIGAAWDSRGYYYRTGGSDGGKNTFATNEIVSVAFDADTGKIWWRKSGGSWQDSGNPETGANPSFTASGYSELMPFVNGESGGGLVANFGADSSFAGNKTPQGNQDSNSVGDFYYAPPSGFLSLCTKSLPSVDVIPSENFNTVLYTGNATARSIAGLDFQPDLTWIKARSATYAHTLVDSIRGTGNWLESNATAAEQTGGAPDAFNSDGFDLTTWGQVNGSGVTFVAWNWKAGGSASSNTNGTITSSVSANPSAGFSIVSYTGTGANATVGHGLSFVPTLLIVKKRASNGSDGVRSWAVYNSTLGNAQGLYLNATNAVFAAGNFWNSTTPTSSVFSIGSGTSSQETNINGDTYIAYAFHSVDSYSKVGTYVGNGNVDGPFVHCGFKPAYILAKVASSQINAANWQIYDTARGTFNPVDDYLFADTSGAESASAATYFAADILSNGFKIRAANTYGMNQLGATYIFLAFAETPFKFSNAR